MKKIVNAGRVVRAAAAAVFWGCVWLACTFVACTPEDDAPIDAPGAPQFETDESPADATRDDLAQLESGLSAQPLTFWMYAGGDRDKLTRALNCALDRVRWATCLPLDVSYYAAHWVRWYPASLMGGRYGWLTGEWNAGRIRLLDDQDEEQDCDTLTHEIAQHLLRRSNGHVGAVYGLHEELLTAVCAVQPCTCLVPEP